MQIKQEFISLFKGFLLGIVVILGISALAWNGPVSAPPNYNAYAPINISTSSQTKSGALWAASFLTEGGGYFGGDVQIVGNCTGCGGVPSGAVLAFNLPSCPSGWSEYTSARGRTIIGVNPDTSNGLSVRMLGATVGEENHTLTTAEMPAHRHRNALPNTPGGGEPYRTDGTTNGGGSDPAVGGNQPHNVMQPSTALLYCQKN